MSSWSVRLTLCMHHPYGDGDSTWIKLYRECHYSSQCSRNLRSRRCYHWLFLPPSSLRVLEVHICGIRGIYSSKFISAIRKTMFRYYFSIIFTCHAFEPSSISFLRVGNTFSNSSPFDVTRLQNKVLMSHRMTVLHSQCQWKRICLSLTIRMAMSTDLGFKRHQESRYSSQCSRKLRFRHYY